MLALLLHLLFEASTLRLLSLISNSSRKFSKNSTSINRKEEDNSNAKSKKMSERSLITVVKWKITEAQILRTRKSTQKSDISFRFLQLGQLKFTAATAETLLLLCFPSLKCMCLCVCVLVQSMKINTAALFSRCYYIAPSFNFAYQLSISRAAATANKQASCHLNAVVALQSQCTCRVRLLFSFCSFAAANYQHFFSITLFLTLS